MDIKRPTIPFPYHYVLLNSVIILVVANYAFASSSFAKPPEEFFEYIKTFIAASFFGIPVTIILSAFCLIYQFLLHRFLRKKLYHRFSWLILFLLPAISLIGVEVYSKLKPISIDPILKSGRLAELPDSAINVEYGYWSAMFTGVQYLKFKAPNDEIDDFIKNSPSLQNAERHTFNLRLPWPNESHDQSVPYDQWENYYRADPNAPKWFTPTVLEKGSRYEIPADDRHNWGTVIIDEHKGIVYVTVTWS